MLRLDPLVTALPRRLLPGFVLLGLILPRAVQAQFSYTTNNGTITITRYDCSASSAVIPDTINGLPVTEIGVGAFSSCFNLTSITIPDSIVRISAAAFIDCAALTSVTIPKSVVSIGKSAFERCNSLAAIDVDLLNTAYSSLEGVLFDKRRTTLIQCPEAKAGTYSIPVGVTTLGEFAFNECVDLTSIEIPNSVTTIGAYAFFGCRQMESAAIPIGVASIELDTFAACSGLNRVIIPNSVTNIGRQAFLGCTSLTNVMMGSRVTSIDNEAFWACTSLRSIVVPGRVTSVGAAVFGSCPSLTAVHFEGNALVVHSDFFAESYNVVVYYLPGTTGWGPTFGDRPTALWVRPEPTLLTQDSRFGPQTNGFSFVISWATNAIVAVDASPTLFNPAWSQIATRSLTNGTAYFSDPLWAIEPARFYRVRQWPP